MVFTALKWLYLASNYDKMNMKMASTFFLRLGLKSRNEYHGIHRWLDYFYGKAKEHECISDGDHDGRLEWANIDGLYKKDVNHFIILCRKHHLFLDYPLDAYEIPQEKIGKRTYRKNKHPLQFYFPELAK